MSSFKLTAAAKNDLKEIARYTEEEWGRKQRNFYIKQFDDAFHKLSRAPSIGISCDFIRKDYRTFPQGSHIIFYKEGTNSEIEIIRILHKRMDVNLHL